MDLFTSALMILFTLNTTMSEILLSGFGASFPQEVYQTWASAFENYRQRFIEVDLKYTAAGSGRVKERLTNRNQSSLGDDVYMAIDITPNPADLSKNGGFKIFPVMAGAVVLGYNLPGITNLNLTMKIIELIYNGTIKQWNHTLIQTYNPEAALPDKDIITIVRIDDSGTTEIFTSALSNSSSVWRDAQGTFSAGFTERNGDVIRTKWPQQLNEMYVGRTNRAVAGIILSYVNSIGYMAVSEAEVAQVNYAKIVSQDGQILSLSEHSLRKAMLNSMDALSTNLTADLVRFVDKGAYPIIGYSYFMTNTNKVKSCEAAREFVRYVDWIMTDRFARTEANDFHHAVPPEEIKHLVTTRILKNLVCGGRNLYSWMLQKAHEEELSMQTWRIPVMIISPIVAVILLALLSYLGYQQLKLRNAIVSDNWKIPQHTIEMSWSRRWGASHQGYANSQLSVDKSINTNYSMVPNDYVIALGAWKGRKICLRSIQSPNFHVHHKEVKKTLIKLRDQIHHVNVLKFFGLTYTEDGMFIVSEYTPKGTLSDVVQNENYRIDDNIKFSFASDIAHGMLYLHDHGIVHGNLNSECCLIDSKWNIKISEWEHVKLDFVCLTQKKSQIFPLVGEKIGQLKSVYTDPNTIAKSQIWTAPEVLLSSGGLMTSKKPGDVYSYSMLLVEIFSREDPYSELFPVMEPTGIIDCIIKKDVRPCIKAITNDGVIDMITQCWNSDPNKRPIFNSIKKNLENVRPSKKSIMDCMMDTLEDYISNLEEKVEERTAELAAANQGLENLLHQILPPSVADKLANGQVVVPEQFDSVTIYFSDIVGFTKICESSTAMEVITMLNDLYNIFDWIIDRHDVYKVETIGDAYMVISGLPKRNGIQHAGEIGKMALDFIEGVKNFVIRHRTSENLLIRAGVHSGPVVAGVVGSKMPRYCLFGDTVNVASRMESTSLPMKIHLSQSTSDLLNLTGGYVIEERGETDIKGKGKLMTYFLQEKSGYKPEPITSIPTTTNQFLRRRPSRYESSKL